MLARTRPGGVSRSAAPDPVGSLEAPVCPAVSATCHGLHIYGWPSCRQPLFCNSASLNRGTLESSRLRRKWLCIWTRRLGMILGVPVHIVESSARRVLRCEGEGSPRSSEEGAGLRSTRATPPASGGIPHHELEPPPPSSLKYGRSLRGYPAWPVARWSGEPSDGRSIAVGTRPACASPSPTDRIRGRCRGGGRPRAACRAPRRS